MTVQETIDDNGKETVTAHVSGRPEESQQAPAPTGGQAAPEAAPVAAPTSLDLTASNRPAWLPPQYKTPEEFAKAHTELQARLSGKKDDKAVLTDADMVGYANEINALGDLSPESRKALLDKGLPQSVIDQHVRGLKSERDGLLRDAFAIVGGPEKYGEVAKWATENLDAADMDMYNRATRSGDPSMVKFAVRGLKAQYDAANGVSTAPATQPAPARRLAGSPPVAQAVKPFTSLREQAQAQRDPRWERDAAYTAEVNARIMASTF